MKERVIANWLTNANELSYTIPFCQLLVAKGMKVISVQPKKATNEQGKDVIALDKKGVVHCYQLKGKDITLSRWRSEIYPEMIPLLENMPIAPGLPDFKDWKCYLVTNGELKGEASNELDTFNRTRELDGKKRKVEFIGAGVLETEFIEHYAKFIPDTLRHFGLFLDIYNSAPDESIDIPQYCTFWNEYFKDYLSEKKKTKFSKNSLIQLINAATVINSYLLGTRYTEKNIYSVIQGWAILLQYIQAIRERYDFEESGSNETISLIKEEIFSLNFELIEEIHSSELLDKKQGAAISEALLFRHRFTDSVGFATMILIAQVLDGHEVKSQTDFLKYVLTNLKHLRIEGEGDVPGFVAFFMLLILAKMPDDAVAWLKVLTEAIVNGSTKIGLADPYHSFDEILKARISLDPKDVIDEDFIGSTYSLLALIETCALFDLREIIEPQWKTITRLHLREFIPEESWQYFMHSVQKGILFNTQPKHTQSWKELIDKSQAIPKKIPKILLGNGDVFLLWLVYPHRYNSYTNRILLNRLNQE